MSIEELGNQPSDEIVFDNEAGTYVVRDSEGQFFGIGADGIEMTTPAESIGEALDDLAVARIIEKGEAAGVEPLVIEIGEPGSADPNLNALIEDMGFDPEDFKLEQ